MRIHVWASVLAVGLSLAAGVMGAVPQGVRGVVDRKLEGVSGYNQSLDDAMNGDNPKDKQPPAVVVPGAIKAGWMTRKSHDGKDVRLYFAYPEGLTKAKPAAGLIVLQEEWGMNDEMQERARDLASHGYYAVAPDLYNGKVTVDPVEAKNAWGAMTPSATLSAMKTGLDLLQEEAGNGVVDAKRIGTVGWSMGGEQALVLATSDTRVKAVAVIYGPLMTDASRLKALQGPVLGIFAVNDKNPDATEVRRFQEALRTAGKTDVTVWALDEVGHDFATKSTPKAGVYNEAKAKEAGEKLYTWLDGKLGG